MKSSAVNLAANIFANSGDTLSQSITSAKENTVFASFMSRAGQGQNVGCGTQVKQNNDSRNSQDSVNTDNAAKPSQSKKADGVHNTEETKTDVKADKIQKPESAEKGQEPEEAQEMTEETMALLSGFVMEVQNLFMEKFQITEEEFANLMMELDIQVEDLMNPEALTDMVKTLGGAEDATAFLVNEELYTACREIIQQTAAIQENLLEQMNITPEDLEQMLGKFQAEQMAVAEEADLNESAIEPENLAEMGEIPEAGLENQEVQLSEKTEVRPEQKNGQEGNMEMLEEQNPELNVKNETEREADVDLEAEQKGDELSELKMTDEAEPVVMKETSNTKQESSKDSKDQPQHSMTDFVNQLREHTNMNVQTAGTEFLTSDVDYESIIRQISEQIRVHVTEDFSSMEMYLNPESLGKVEMHLLLKQGALSAQFSVENEQVKEAMESQMVQLQEDFDKQGLKVEMIEVTVKSHEFEQNLMQGEERNPQSGQEGSKTHRVLRFGLEELAEDADFLSDEELAEKIMKEDGTTLNYLA